MLHLRNFNLLLDLIIIFNNLEGLNIISINLLNFLNLWNLWILIIAHIDLFSAWFISEVLWFEILWYTFMTNLLFLFTFLSYDHYSRNSNNSNSDNNCYHSNVRRLSFFNYWLFIYYRINRIHRCCWLVSFKNDRGVHHKGFSDPKNWSSNI